MAGNSPFVVDLLPVTRVAGVRHDRHLVGRLTGVELPAVRVPQDEDVQADLTLEFQGGALVVEGQLTVPWRGECRRCLEETSGQLELDLREVYVTDPIEGETYPLPEERLDLAPMLREVITLALPPAPLCGEDCAGPSPDKHPVQVEDPEAGPPRRSDDPWSALDDLDLDLE